jgi:hypothetical protein
MLTDPCFNDGFEGDLVGEERATFFLGGDTSFTHLPGVFLVLLLSCHTYN